MEYYKRDVVAEGGVESNVIKLASHQFYTPKQLMLNLIRHFKYIAIVSAFLENSIRPDHQRIFVRVWCGDNGPYYSLLIKKRPRTQHVSVILRTCIFQLLTLMLQAQLWRGPFVHPCRVVKKKGGGAERQQHHAEAPRSERRRTRETFRTATNQDTCSDAVTTFKPICCCTKSVMAGTMAILWSP